MWTCSVGHALMHTQTHTSVTSFPFLSYYLSNHFMSSTPSPPPSQSHLLAPPPPPCSSLLLPLLPFSLPSPLLSSHPPLLLPSSLPSSLPSPPALPCSLPFPPPFPPSCKGCKSSTQVDSSYQELELSIENKATLQECLHEFFKVRRGTISPSRTPDSH